MIKPQELRIGNLVNYMGNQHTINGVSVGHVNLEFMLEETDNPSFPSRYKNINPNKIEPIPLTEDILLKYGFKQSKEVHTTYVLSLDTYFLSPSINLYAYLNKQGIICGFRLIQGQNRHGNMLSEILSVHQLQNLIYMLAGQEMNLELSQIKNS